MPFIELRNVITQKPDYEAPLKTDHPLYASLQGVLSTMVGAEFRESLNNNISTVASGGDIQTIVTDAGRMFAFDGSNDKMYTTDHTLTPPNLEQWGCFVCTVDASGITRVLQSDATTGQYYGIIQSVDSTSLQVTLGDGTGTGSTDRRSFHINHSLSDGDVAIFSYRILTNTTGDFYVNGVKHSYTTSGTGGTYATGGAVNSRIGHRRIASTDYIGYGAIGLIITGNGTPNLELLRSLSSNPWQLFEDEVSHLPYTAAAGGTTSELSSGSFTLSDSTLDSLYNRKSQLSTGSFALTAANIDTIYARLSQLDSGSFGVNGSNIDTLFNHKSHLDSGSFNLTGSNVDTLYDRLMVAESGAFVLTGNNVDTLFNRVSQLDSGSFNVSGSAITTTYDSLAPTASLESGSFAITGTPVDSLVHHVTRIVSGAFALTGSAIDSTVSLVTDINTGAFILTGNNIQSLYDRLSVFESGAFSIDGSTISTAIIGVGVDVIIDIQLVHDISNKIRLDCATSAISLKRVQND